MERVLQFIRTSARKLVNKEIDTELWGGPNCPVAWLYQPERPCKDDNSATPKQS